MMNGNHNLANHRQRWPACSHRLLLIGALLMLFCSSGLPAQQGNGPVDTVLFGTVFGDLYGPGILTSHALPPDVKVRIIDFQRRAKAFRSRLPREQRGPGPERYTHSKKIQLERGMVALISAPGIAQEARDFALKAPLAYEWEGMSDGPLTEEAFAEHYLESHPGTPLLPYLKLFLVHRQRCAFETLMSEGSEQAAVHAAKRYRSTLASALADPDPLVRFIAADFEKRPFIYLKTGSSLSKLAQEVPAVSLECPEAGVGASSIRSNEIAFTGEIKKGETFERTFGPGLLFRLEPTPLGWTITVREPGRDEDLSRLTPPFHFVPNPRDLEGWHLRNANNTGPNEAGEKNVNAPAVEREFIFSPEVGCGIQGVDTTTSPSEDEVEKVRAYGRGALKVIDYRLNNLEPGHQAGFEWLRFEVMLSWPGPPLSNPSSSSEPTQR
jgi:hypothetical protein